MRQMPCMLGPNNNVDGAQRRPLERLRDKSAWECPCLPHAVTAKTENLREYTSDKIQRQ
jgi:hypothetical protein